jgi:hypothetical protein
MPSPLSFASTTNFRNALIVKNLSPYTVTGTYSPPSGAINYETSLSNFSVIDSPNNLNILSPTNYYVINQFGPNGGYDLKMYDLQVLVNAPNEGPYLQSFLPSKYTPYSILLNNNPTGSDGSLSQDSFIAKLGATFLKKSFEDRINFEIYQSTVGVVNLSSLQDPFQASLIATGQQPLIYRNWKITVPENPIIAAADFATRLAGAYWPVSFIPGDYFNENENNGLPTTQTSGALSTVNQLTGGLLGPILNLKRNPSQIFLANTGNGQKSALFANLYYNKYKPNYDSSYGGPLGAVVGLVNTINNIINPNGTVVSHYYIGSPNSDASQITSPANQVPINSSGQQVLAPVYGPDEISKLFEGNINDLNFGLGGNGKSIDGDFVWTSPKYKNNAGFHPTVGGGAGSKDGQFNLISSKYQSDESTNLTFKKDSILDNTQKLVESADNVTGPNRLRHVGNAINQVSKVFNDGYKEMTKGSQVVSYSDNTTGAEAGIEYCRVFAKDTPYYTFADLQKTDGITTSGRQFNNSVLDNTYNLNIAPLKNPGSTNIIPGDKDGVGGYAKKYMFSIENLAWRTSGREGFRVSDLPVCERGPNGGRVMWFPPYDIKFSDSSTANWNPTSFIGRPEPIYTYKETSRSGQLSWKIVVDHPSVLNTIVNYQLKDGSSERVNSIIESFFAGCAKFDLYTLAAKFNKIPISELQQIQTALNNPRLTPEELSALKVSIPAENTTVEGNGANSTGNPTQTSTTPDTSVQEFEQKYLSFALYFDNDIPGPHNSTSKTADIDYLSAYNAYIGQKSKYESNSQTVFKKDSPEAQTNGFFDNVVISNFNMIAGNDSNFITDAIKLLEAGHGPIKVKMVGSASAVATDKYNIALSNRRLDSVKKFFSSKGLGKYIDDKKFDIFLEKGAGENIVLPIMVNEVASGTTTVDTKDFGGIIGNDIDCSKLQIPEIGPNNSTTRSVAQIYSTSAMACRRVKISEISVTPKQNEDILIDNKPVVPETVEANVTTVKPQPIKDVSKGLKQGLSKKVLRALLSECDYFEMIKENDPMVYSSLKEKIKYFNPAFHSMTPEGLNSRITFLNQCVRPGDTIPVIGPDGKPVYNDATNTSFGSAPVLILRIGDFYHTKIIPTNLSFTYEPLLFDMNPEGIGVQPMIVDVSLNFNIIGGMGLKGPIDQLQNALSFNFYANTEIYDERATAPEETLALDKKVFDSIVANSGNAKDEIKNNQQENKGGTPIGIIKTTPATINDTGEMIYGKVMDDLIDLSKEYFTNIPNQLEKVVLQYNYGTLNMFNSVSTDKGRIYTDGTIGATIQNGLLYGKPQINETTKDLFEKTKLRINIGDANPIISILNKKFDKDTVNITLIKQNMCQYIDDMTSSYNSGLESIIKDIVSQENSLLTLISKLNLINTKTDGIIKDGSTPVVYNISGSTGSGEVNSASLGVSNTFDEFSKDYKTLPTNLVKFNELLTKEKILTKDYTINEPFKPLTNKVDEKSDLLFFMVMARVLTDPNKLESYKNFVISGPLTNPKNKKIAKEFKNICDDLSKQYKDELDGEEKMFSKFKKNKDYAKYTTGITEIMYPKGKVRKMKYSTVKIDATQSKQEQDLKNIYGTVNYGEKAKNLNYFDGKINI